MHELTSTVKAKEVMSELVKLFSTNDFPDVAAKAYIVAPEIPSSSWSFNNRIIMFMGGTSDARGYKQWNDVGRKIKKGSKAIYILAPWFEKRKNRDDDEEEEPERLIGFRCMPKFRYEDTEGNDLPEYKPIQLPPLFDLAKYNGISVKYENTVIGEYGSINIKNKKMTLSTESPDTFFHELIHFYDLRNRDDVKPGQDKTQEIVAQLGACVLARMYGHDSTAYTWRYIASYSKTKDPEKIGRECVSVIERVGRVITNILADAEKIEGSIPVTEGASERKLERPQSIQRHHPATKND